MTKELFIDGACSGNPGPTRIAVFSEDLKIKTIQDTGNGTNNRAEYQALLYALAIAQSVEDDIVIKSDSKLVVEQVNGNWKVKDQKLIPLCKDAQILIDMRKELFNASTELEWLSRERNLAGHMLE
jgi:ribonuclease HI